MRWFYTNARFPALIFQEDYMNNALYLNGSKTAYPFAVATHYSFDAGQLHLFKTREAALAFIQQTREDEIANDRDMGYEYRKILRLDETKTFTYAAAEDGSWFRIEEIRASGDHDTTIWSLIESFDIIEDTQK